MDSKSKTHSVSPLVLFISGVVIATCLMVLLFSFSLHPESNATSSGASAVRSIKLSDGTICSIDDSTSHILIFEECPTTSNVEEAIELFQVSRKQAVIEANSFDSDGLDSLRSNFPSIHFLSLSDLFLTEKR